MQLKRTPILTGLISASVLADAEAFPEGKIAQGLQLCNALEIRYDLFPDQSEWPLIAKRVHQLNAAAFLLEPFACAVMGVILTMPLKE